MDDVPLWVMSSIQEDPEKHIDYLENQLSLVDQMGLQNYLQTAAGGIKD